MTKTTHSTSMNNDKGNIGIITNERQLENLEGDVTILFKVVDKLENIKINNLILVYILFLQ